MQLLQLAQLPGDWLKSPFFKTALNDISFEPKGFFISDIVASPVMTDDEKQAALIL